MRTAVRYLWFSTYNILSLLWRQASLVAAGAGLLPCYVRLAVSTAIGYLGLVAFSLVMLYVLSAVASAFKYLWRGTSVITVAVGEEISGYF